MVDCGRPAGRPRLRFKDVCKRDMKSCHIDINTWEACAEDRATWRLLVKQGTKESEKERKEAATEKRAKRKERQQHPQHLQKASPFVCNHCTKDCHSRIGLFSHSRSCR